MRVEKQNYDFGDVDTAQQVARAREAELTDTIDAAHGLICNAHRKRVDDVTDDDGASPGWAEAARRWIDAYPPARSNPMDQTDCKIEDANNGREELRLAAERVLTTHSLPQYSAQDHDEAIDTLAAALTIVREYLASR